MLKKVIVSINLFQQVSEQILYLNQCMKFSQRAVSQGKHTPFQSSSSKTQFEQNEIRK